MAMESKSCNGLYDLPPSMHSFPLVASRRAASPVGPVKAFPDPTLGAPPYIVDLGARMKLETELGASIHDVRCHRCKGLVTKIRLTHESRFASCNSLQGNTKAPAPHLHQSRYYLASSCFVASAIFCSASVAFEKVEV